MYLAHRNGFRRVLALAVACGVVYIGCCVLAIMGRENGVLGGYKSFKLTSFFMPLFGAAIVSLLSVWRSRNRVLTRVVKMFAVVIVLFGFLIADSVILRPSRFARVASTYTVMLGLDRATWVQSINAL